jgi:hypothetical protein
MVASRVSVSNLSELIETAARLQRRSRELVNRAGHACLVARQFGDHSRTDREQRGAWASLAAQIPLEPDHVVVLCASCRRAQWALGWTILPPGVEHRLMTWDRAVVSHGFCPDCLRRQLLPDWLALEVRAAC